MAIKIPNLTNGWVNFLEGLIGNIQEREFWKTKSDLLCPVLLSLPLGLLNVYPRCTPITDEEYSDLDTSPFYYRHLHIPVEEKQSSFGWYKGRVVAVDYGS